MDEEINERSYRDLILLGIHRTSRRPISGRIVARRKGRTLR